MVCLFNQNAVAVADLLDEILFEHVPQLHHPEEISSGVAVIDVFEGGGLFELGVF